MKRLLLLPALLVLCACSQVRLHPQFERQWEDLYGCARSTTGEGEAQQKCAGKYADVEITGRLATVVPMSNGNARLDVDGVLDATTPREKSHVVTCILTPPLDVRRINSLVARKTWVTVHGPLIQVASNASGNTLLLAPCELNDTAEGPPEVATSQAE
ncbi:hypothetical protein FGE12_14895 [Aggregicoccus sp. 17bor-14]|uniref:hypothetical protein n=1 Tax=Myxococcaceae TaxID=31 RepID=UPI00129C4BFF|nr:MULTISPECIES: hypothetical protein [Myxococcaceae]MBF5043682.1 hypothetical protein [Simulacricoccus sp. 17bor-14]MRI89439.1 hypothetical protein [Aggregicoccus sp. 17bor-14]